MLTKHSFTQQLRYADSFAETEKVKTSVQRGLADLTSDLQFAVGLITFLCSALFTL